MSLAWPSLAGSGRESACIYVCCLCGNWPRNHQSYLAKWTQRHEIWNENGVFVCGTYVMWCDAIFWFFARRKVPMQWAKWWKKWRWLTGAGADLQLHQNDKNAVWKWRLLCCNTTHSTKVRNGIHLRHRIQIIWQRQWERDRPERELQEREQTMWRCDVATDGTIKRMHESVESRWSWCAPECQLFLITIFMDARLCVCVCVVGSTAPKQNELTRKKMESEEI